MTVARKLTPFKPRPFPRPILASPESRVIDLTSKVTILGGMSSFAKREISTVEAALAATGLNNRGQAFLAVCRAYLETKAKAETKP